MSQTSFAPLIPEEAITASVNPINPMIVRVEVKSNSDRTGSCSMILNFYGTTSADPKEQIKTGKSSKLLRSLESRNPCEMMEVREDGSMVLQEGASDDSVRFWAGMGFECTKAVKAAAQGRPVFFCQFSTPEFDSSEVDIDDELKTQYGWSNEGYAKMETRCTWVKLVDEEMALKNIAHWRSSAQPETSVAPTGSSRLSWRKTIGLRLKELGQKCLAAMGPVAEADFSGSAAAREGE